MVINAIWAIFYHSINGPPSETLEQQHRYCLATSDSWCKYQQDVRMGASFYDKSNCLPKVFRDELTLIFERLSSSELLSSCQKRLTQNVNESINGIVWSRCPKRVFCGKQRYTISVCDAICQFNEGAKGRKRLLDRLNLRVSMNAQWFAER